MGLLYLFTHWTGGWMGPHTPSGRLGGKETFSPDPPACSPVTIVTTPYRVSDCCLTKIKGIQSYAVIRRTDRLKTLHRVKKTYIYAHAQEDKGNWQKNWQTWWETFAVPENIQFSFSCRFLKVKVYNLTQSVGGHLLPTTVWDSMHRYYTAALNMQGMHSLRLGYVDYRNEPITSTTICICNFPYEQATHTTWASLNDKLTVIGGMRSKWRKSRFTTERKLRT